MVVGGVDVAVMVLAVGVVWWSFRGASANSGAGGGCGGDSAPPTPRQ